MKKFKLQQSSLVGKISGIIPWETSPPFVHNTRACLVHRPREISTFTHQAKSYIGMTLYCGASFNGRDVFYFSDKLDSNVVLCKLCEVNAVRSKLPSASRLSNEDVYLGKRLATQLELA